MDSISLVEKPHPLLSALTGETIDFVGPQVYFPLTADPPGYHHLLLAECALRQIPGIKKVVFILSNGMHPDPMKRRTIPEGEIRLSLLKLALEGFINPGLSYPSGLALKANSPLKLIEQTWKVSTSEFESSYPVRLAEHVLHLVENMSSSHLRKSDKSFDTFFEEGSPVPMLIGTDLLDRMLDVRIFKEADLRIIAQHSLLLVIPRGIRNLTDILFELQEKRGLTLNVGKMDPNWLPENLRVLLNLSSTIIRRSVQAGQPLLGFMPQSASDLIHQNRLYLSDGNETQANDWQQHCQKLENELEHSAKMLLKSLDKRLKLGRYHTISLVESGTGGRIATAFTAIPGASRHLHQILVPYSRNAQQELLSATAGNQPYVSSERAKALATSLQISSNSDWVIGETGMAGPLSPERRSRKNGLCHVALAIKGNHSKEISFKTLKIECNPFLTKKEHQLQFALQSLNWLLDQLDLAESV